MISGGGGSPYHIWGEGGKETIEEGIFRISTFLYRDKEIIGAGYVESFSAYTVKKVRNIPVPSRDVTYQTLNGQEKLNYSRLERVW